MPRKKLLYTCHFEPEQLKRLRSMSVRTRVPVAVLIRRAVEEFLEKEDRPPPTPDPGDGEPLSEE